MTIIKYSVSCVKDSRKFHDMMLMLLEFSEKQDTKQEEISGSNLSNVTLHSFL